MARFVIRDGHLVPIETAPPLGLPSVQGDYKKPIHLLSMAIDPDEVKVHRERFPDVEITNDGVPIMHSRVQKKAYLRAMGWEETNGFGT
jgi:hypothetical protein